MLLRQLALNLEIDVPKSYIPCAGPSGASRRPTTATIPRALITRGLTSQRREGELDMSQNREPLQTLETHGVTKGTIRSPLEWCEGLSSFTNDI